MAFSSSVESGVAGGLFVVSPEVEDGDPSPDGSGTVTKVELIKKLVEKGANLNARTTHRLNFG